jgi:hypothetical protein
VTVALQDPQQHRLHALCPYFAMFPPSFATENIQRYTRVGDLVLDPFSGRGTTLLEALLNGRAAIASDINPVAYCVSSAKARPPELELVHEVLDELEDHYYRADVGRLEAACLALPRFFHVAFARETLRQLLFLRSKLRWHDDPVRGFVAALLLGHLHGESERSEHYCSNQMPHSISTKPAYSLRYWRRHGLRAPRRDVFELLRDRADYRLAEGVPDRRGHVGLVDVREAARRFRWFSGQAAAVVTSPPYLSTTRFEEDQWLRLWFLGGAPRPTFWQVSKDDRHEWVRPYWAFLAAAWRGIAPLLKRGAILVCRLGARRLTADALQAGLLTSVRSVWPRAELVVDPVTTPLRRRQSAVLNPASVGCRYEVDFAFRLTRAR